MTDQSEAEAAVERLTAFAGWCENPRGDDDEAFSDYTNGNCAADLRLLLAERRGFVEALPDPEKLLDLALWLDMKDEQDGRDGDEVQQDLRCWAFAARSALQGNGGG